jgi:hypothetical protein
MSELSFAAKKIMVLFIYFQVSNDGFIPEELLEKKTFVAGFIEEEEIETALNDLTSRGYIIKMKDSKGWKLLEEGKEYLKHLDRTD